MATKPKPGGKDKNRRGEAADEKAATRGMYLPRAKAWEQQPGETALQYALFSKFRDTDAEERSVRKTYIAHYHKEAEAEAFYREHGKPYDCPGGIYELATRWKWRERAMAHDREVERKVMRVMAQRRVRAMTEIADMGELLRKKAMTALRMMTAVTQNIGTHDGREVVVMATNLTPDQIAKLADVGTKIEQLALGMPTERFDGAEQPSDVTLENAKEKLRKRIMEIRARREEAAADDEV